VKVLNEKTLNKRSIKSEESFEPKREIIMKELL